MQFRATSTGKLLPAKYPRFALAEQHEAKVIDIVHETGRDAPLSKILFESGIQSFIPSVLGTKIGSKLFFGLKAGVSPGNVISIQNIPDGTIVCNVEKHFGDGGAYSKICWNICNSLFT